MKKNIAVLFGGQSSEHYVSLVSATTIMNHIDLDLYNIYPVGITLKGEWFYYEGDVQYLKEDQWLEKGPITKAIISPDAHDGGLLLLKNTGVELVKIDAVVPALHGLFGEDGTVQGLLELAQIPYVGCGVLSSAVSMDKFFTKIIVDTLGIKQARFVGVYRHELEEMSLIVDKIEEKFDYPVFIKPSNAGSSMGVSKAHDRGELVDGLIKAGEHDHKILVEEFIAGREVECAVLGNQEAKSSGVGEILPAAEFYDYDAKYNNAESKTVLNADLPEATRQQIRENALQIFKAVDGAGLARVDFFVSHETGEVVFNEINTLPGFTSISMYPMLWNEQGVDTKELVNKLITLAIEG